MEAKIEEPELNQFNGGVFISPGFTASSRDISSDVFKF
jgi:hypothetical protein